MQGNPQIVDSISLPRDTLSRITGDCDDLTVLYCSLLETVGIETAFITVPGHIYAAFNTKVQARSFKDVHPDRNLFINFEGELWIPVEITMIGKTDFLEAWRKGIEEYAAQDNSPEKRGFYVTRKSQEIFRPVGLKETDLGLQYGRKDAIAGGFSQDMKKLMDQVLGEYIQAAKAEGKKQDYNKLGIAYAKFRQYPLAEESFRKAISLDAQYIDPLINLGNLQFLAQKYEESIGTYQNAAVALAKKNQSPSGNLLKVYLNMSKAFYQISKFEDAKMYYEKAQTIDKTAVEQFSYLAQSAGSGEGRAAEGRDPKIDILFADE